MQVTLPWPPAGLSPNARLHWAQKSKLAKAYRRACHVLTLEAGLRGIDWEGDIHVWIDFYRPTRRTMDHDNCLSRIKSGLDGIADALGVNDSRFRPHPYIQDAIGGMVKVRITPGPETEKAVMT